MDNLSYIECKELVYETFQEYINDEGFNDEQALAASLEDSVLMIKNNKVSYIAVIHALAIISLNKKIIPDYIFEKLMEINSIDETLMIDNDKEAFIKDKEAFIKDKEYIKLKLEQHNYIILEDEVYRMRISMLLS